jgi:fructokinase
MTAERTIAAPVATVQAAAADHDANSSMVTTWLVEPVTDDRSRVRATTTWNGTGGIGGLVERASAPRGLARIHDRVLRPRIRRAGLIPSGAGAGRGPPQRWPHVARASPAVPRQFDPRGAHHRHLAPGVSVVTAPDPSGPDGSGDGVVAVAGEALVDLVPAPVGGYFEIAPGGSPANVALGLARLGVPARLLARIADDLLGRRIRDHLTRNGVQLDHAVAAHEQTSLAMVSLDADGSPAYDFRINGTADWQWTPAELAGALDPGPSGPVVALHSGSLALTTGPGDGVLRDLLMRASETITISYDPNCRPMLMGRPEAILGGVHEMLGVADIVKVSSEDLHWLVPDMTPEQVVDDWLSRGPALVAVTLGADGVVAGTSAGLRVRRAGVPVKVIDTVGAGDTFSAALLAGLYGKGLLGASRRSALAALDFGTLDELLHDAVLAAAITCSRRGADPPTRGDLRLSRMA